MISDTVYLAKEEPMKIDLELEELPRKDFIMEIPNEEFEIWSPRCQRNEKYNGEKEKTILSKCLSIFCCLSREKEFDEVLYAKN